MIDIFKTGDKQTLSDILANREVREKHKKVLLSKNHDETLISVTFNIPGDLKNNVDITRGFHRVFMDFKHYLEKNGLSISLDEQFSKPTGPEGYFLIDSQESTKIKQICIDYETDYQIGRLLDIDVYQLVDSEIQLVDRMSLQQEPRLCYICAQPAKECARNQTHSIEELRTKINEMFEELL